MAQFQNKSINQRQFNAFRMMIRLGSITAATHALTLSQPAVSRLMADMDFPLLLRHGGKAQPTLEAH